MSRDLKVLNVFQFVHPIVNRMAHLVGKREVEAAGRSTWVSVPPIWMCEPLLDECPPFYCNRVIISIIIFPTVF